LNQEIEILFNKKVERGHLMKKYYCLIFSFIYMIFYLDFAQAGVFDVQIYQSIAADSENIVENGTGCKIRAYLDDLYFFIG